MVFTIILVFHPYFLSAKPGHLCYRHTHISPLLHSRWSATELTHLQELSFYTVGAFNNRTLCHLLLINMGVVLLGTSGFLQKLHVTF